MKVLEREHDKILFSDEDVSINRVRHLDLSHGESIETRIVQRSTESMMLYMSTHAGCSNSCRFCHLTQTNQVSKRHLLKDDYVDQISWVIEQLENDPRIFLIDTVHVNFMARGDALSSPYFMMHYDEIQEIISSNIRLIFNTSVIIKFKISTIFPIDSTANNDGDSLKKWLSIATMCNDYGETEFYYSLYSLNPLFRKKWIPKAISPDKVGELFKGHRVTDDKTTFRLHHALIEGQNDSLHDIKSIQDWLEKYDIECYINIVRYNPFDAFCGTEPDEEWVERYAEVMRESSRVVGVKIVSRVGRDVAASCGTFISDNL